MSERIRVGDPVPDVTFQAVDGGTVRTRDLRGRPALIVFLRHLY
jgi:peroxiredoxin